MDHFGGYTAGSSTVAGYWREEDGSQSYGEHREFTVALPNDRGLPDLKRFLALTARRLCESCLYVEVAGSAVLLYSAEDDDLEVDPCLATSTIDEPSSAV